MNTDAAKKISEACYNAAVTMDPAAYATQSMWDFATAAGIAVAFVVVFLGFVYILARTACYEHG